MTNNITDIFFANVVTQTHIFTEKPAALYTLEQQISISLLRVIGQRFTGFKVHGVLGNVALVRYYPLNMPDPVLPILINYNVLGRLHRFWYITYFNQLEHALTTNKTRKAIFWVKRLCKVAKPYLSQNEYTYYYSNMEKALHNPLRPDLLKRQKL